MKIIIGSSGLIGKTLQEKIHFDQCYNSKNIDQFNDLAHSNSELYLSCLPAEKWRINLDPEKDLKNALSIFSKISKKRYRKIFLFSTIDVYGQSESDVTEDFVPTISENNPLNYGSIRFLFERLINDQRLADNIKIFRLPALYSKNIKKNILYDLLNNNNVDRININSCYQWYNLENLVDDIQFFSTKYPSEQIFNLFTEPVNTHEITRFFPEYQYSSMSNGPRYSYRTKFSNSGYLQDSKKVIDDIERFINEYRNK